MTTLRVGDVVRSDSRYDAEGTVVEAGEKGYYVRFDAYPDENGWFSGDKLFIVRGTVPPEERPSFELQDTNK